MDIETVQRCQVDMSIKMIQSHARCRLVCSLPAYCVCLFVFVALRPMSTAMVIAGRSVHLTTLFPGQA